MSEHPVKRGGEQETILQEQFMYERIAHTMSRKQVLGTRNMRWQINRPKITPDLLDTGKDMPIHVIPAGDDTDEKYLNEILSVTSLAEARKTLKRHTLKHLAWLKDHEERCFREYNPPAEMSFTIQQAARIVRERAILGRGKARKIGSRKLLPGEIFCQGYSEHVEIPDRGIPGVCLKSEWGISDQDWHDILAREWAKQDQAAHDVFMYVTGTWAWGASDIGAKFTSLYDEAGEYIGDERIANGTFMGEEVGGDEPDWARILHRNPEAGEIMLESGKRDVAAGVSFISLDRMIEESGNDPGDSEEIEEDDGASADDIEESDDEEDVI